METLLQWLGGYVLVALIVIVILQLFWLTMKGGE